MIMKTQVGEDDDDEDEDDILPAFIEKIIAAHSLKTVSTNLL